MASVPVNCGSFCKASDAFALKIAPTDSAAAAPGVGHFSCPARGTPSDSLPVTVIDMGSAALTVSERDRHWALLGFKTIALPLQLRGAHAQSR